MSSNVEDPAEGGAEGDQVSKARSSLEPGRARTPRKAPDQDEEPEVIGGRFLIAVGLVAAVGIIPSSTLGQVFEPEGPEPTNMQNWTVGSVHPVRITLVTADFNKLACQSEESFDGAHCAYKTASEPWPRDPSKPVDDNKLDVVQPYRTWFDNKLVFVAGLWAQPEVAFRVHQEPWFGMQPDKLARFAVECQVRFAGKFKNVKLRWSADQAWTGPDAGATWVGRAQSCKLIEEPQ